MTSRGRELSDPRLAQHAGTSYWMVRPLYPLVLIVLVLILASCGATMTDAPGGAGPASTQVSFGQGSESDHAVAPVVLRDPAPGALDILMTVSFDQLSGDPEPMTEVGLAFHSGVHSVQFAGNERVTCDSVAFPLKDRVAVFQVLRAPTAQVAGTTVQCTYAAGSQTASVTLQIPPAPAITSPQMGAQVVRSTHTLITYRYDSATGTMLGIVALAPSSTVPKTIARLNTPSPLHATVDTSGFLPGPGSIVLTASLQPRITEAGVVAFHTVHAFGTATAQVAVTWM